MSIAKRAKELGYRGELLVPITMPWPPPEANSDRMALKQEVHGKLNEKVELLLEHYQLDATSPDLWRQLVLLLAYDWVPGFKLTTEQPRTRGRKVTVSPDAQVDLFQRVEAIRLSKGLKLGEACIEFLRQNRSDPLWGGKTARHIENQYREGERHSLLDAILEGTPFAGLQKMFKMTGATSRRRHSEKQ